MFNRYDKYRGGYDEGDQEERTFVDDETRERYEKKEEEKRLKIQERFITLVAGLEKDCENMESLIKKQEPEEKARSVRISFTEEELESFTKSMKTINFNLGKARPTLDSYIIFNNTTPKFDFVNNIIFKLHKFIVSTKQRRFYEIHLIKHDKRYFKLVELSKFVEDLAILIKRIEGTLTTGGELIVDYPKLKGKEKYDGQDYYGDRKYYDYRGRFDNYHDKKPLTREQELEDSRRTRSIQKTPLRDIGDEYEDGQ